MTVIIDRRKNPGGKSLDNRRRFIKRITPDIKKTISDAIKNRKIGDFDKGENVRIPSKDIGEPHFRGDRKTGNHKIISPGNKNFDQGDKIDKPQSGGKGRGNSASDDPSVGEDEFAFSISRDEFLDLFFEDLELPDLVKKKLKEIKAFKNKKAGFTNVGNPSALNVIRTMRTSLSRRIALHRPKDEEIEQLEFELLYEENLLAGMKNEEKSIIIQQRIFALKEQIEKLKRKMKRIPFIDPIDLRYNLFLPQPQPNTQALMLCIMDVSGSMGEREKDLSKRFFVLLHMFLKRRYDKVEVIFIRHHTIAKEVSEEEFFNDRETGGTIVSSSLELAENIIKERYPVDDWNIYCAQASDGDNFGGDCAKCKNILETTLMPLLQYFAYVQIDHNYPGGFYNISGQNELWKTYKEVSENHENFNMKSIKDYKDIFPVFRELFSKEDA